MNRTFLPLHSLPETSHLVQAEASSHPSKRRRLPLGLKLETMQVQLFCRVLHLLDSVVIDQFTLAPAKGQISGLQDHPLLCRPSQARCHALPFPAPWPTSNFRKKCRESVVELMAYTLQLHRLRPRLQKLMQWLRQVSLLTKRIPMFLPLLPRRPRAGHQGPSHLWFLPAEGPYVAMPPPLQPFLVH